MRAHHMMFIGLVAVCSLAAQEKRENKEPADMKGVAAQIASYLASTPKPTITKPKPADANLPSLSAFNAFTNLVIPPGQAIPFTSGIDWTGADRASIAIECPPSTSLQKVQIVLQWALPAVAPNYTATDVILGSNLLLPNQGGAVVPVYGNQCKSW